MTKMKPQFSYNDDGKKDGVTVTIKEFERLIDELDDLDDYRLLESIDIEEEIKHAIPLEEVEKRLFGNTLK